MQVLRTVECIPKVSKRKNRVRKKPKPPINSVEKDQSFDTKQYITESQIEICKLDLHYRERKITRHGSDKLKFILESEVLENCDFSDGSFLHKFLFNFIVFSGCFLNFPKLSK